MKTTKNNEKIIINFIKAKSRLNDLNLAYILDKWLKVELSIFHRNVLPTSITYFYNANNFTVKMEFYDKYCVIHSNIDTPYKISLYVYVDIDIILSELEKIISKIKEFNQ